MNWQEKQMWLVGISDEYLFSAATSANKGIEVIDADSLPDLNSDPAQFLLQFEEQGGRPFSARSSLFK